MTDDATFERRVLRAGDDGYDRARHVFNSMIDRRPELIVRCEAPEDVVAGVDLARRQGLALAVKSGGHSVAGTAVCDGGLMLDISPLKRVEVDERRGTATVQAGVTLGELDEATAALGLATPTGIVSVTGLSGLALGGGLGWLNGSHGLTCDNIIAAEIVTADGEVLTASADEHPDLFWAIRGGGGNFGVVTTFTLQLHPVRNVLAGGLSFDSSKGPAALAAYHELASTCPDEFTVNGSIGKGADDEVVVNVGYCHLGRPEAVDGLLATLRALGPVNEVMAPVPFVDLQRESDPGFPEGHQHYWKSGSLTDLGDEAIAILIDQVKRMPSAISGVGLQQLHGAAARVSPTATAYPHRSVRYDFLILSQWPDPSANAENIAWTTDCFDAMVPFLDNGVYVNNLGNEGKDRVWQAYGPNYERLVSVKSIYDPTNFFRHNHNIPPRAV